MKYQKKPVTVDAWQVTDLINRFALHGLEGLPEPVACAYEEGVLDFPTGFIGKPPELIEIVTLQGVMVGTHGSWLVCASRGVFEPYKSFAFDDLFEPIGQSA